jgi:hypothetical protein
MESFWRGNNLVYGIRGPNGTFIEVEPQTDRKVNKHPPARSVSGFAGRSPSPRRNKPSTVVATTRGKKTPYNIALESGPRNIPALLQNKHIPGFIKDGLRQVFYKQLLNSKNLSIKQISNAFAVGGFNNNQKREIYRRMHPRNLIILAAASRLARNVLNERAVPSDKP